MNQKSPTKNASRSDLIIASQHFEYANNEMLGDV